MCSDCKVVSYCSRECLAAALPLHKIECKGVARLEKLRGSEQYRIVEQDDLRSYWPPNVSLLVAHLINKKALHCEQSEGSFIGVHDLALPKTIPLPREVFDILKQCVRYLVPSNVGDDEIYQTFCRVVNNSVDVVYPDDTMTTAIYLEYSLLNHMCKPNCGWEQEYGKVCVFALQNIEPNSQLGISYMSFRYDINLRDTTKGIEREIWF